MLVWPCTIQDVADFLQSAASKTFERDDPAVRKGWEPVMYLKKCWAASNRAAAKFLKNCQDWLSETECFPNGRYLTPVRAGRPTTPFTEKGHRTKLKATKEVRGTCSRAELVLSAPSAVHTR